MKYKSIGLFFKTLSNYSSSQLFYKFYFDVIKKNEIYNKRFIQDNHSVPVSKLKLLIHMVNNEPKVLLNDEKIQFKALNNKLDCEINNLWDCNTSDLVNFNIHYLTFLSTNLSLSDKIFMLDHYIDYSKNNYSRFIYHPFVISIKLVEIIRFMMFYSLKNPVYDQFLISQTKFLQKRIEKHLMANHILFNGIGLLFSAYYFCNEKFFKQAEHILENELSKQFLDDGMHFELSPMYHAIIIKELLKCYDLMVHNKFFKTNLLESIEKTLEKAMGYYNFISVDGFYPNFNDSFFSPDLRKDIIATYFKSLGLKAQNILQSKSSGFRKYSLGSFTMIYDVGQIGPQYQLGHAHADSLTFCLYHNAKPIIVDTGTSIYEDTSQRFIERSTDSHNTVKCGEYNSSDVWSSFRVGRFAKTFIKNERDNYISAYHDGYKFLGFIHNRSINIGDNVIKIYDQINCDHIVTSFLHFHPSEKIEVLENQIIINGTILIQLENFTSFKIEPYMYAAGYNKLEEGMKFIGHFRHFSYFKIKEIKTD